MQVAISAISIVAMSAVAQQPQRPHKSTTHDERFVHLKTPDNPRYNGATLFVRREDDGLWRGSVALCSKHDQFCKRVGRQVARRRYFAFRDQAGWLPGSLVAPSYEGAVHLLQREMAT